MILYIFLILLLSWYFKVFFLYRYSWKSILPSENANNTDFISVIVACRNEENNILNIIEDVKNQNFNKQRFEMIVVNDHSEDSTVLILEKAAKSWENLKIFCMNQEEQGKKNAIKKGINTLIKYFNKDTANLVLKKFGRAKIVTATNVFAHIEDVNSLMKNLLQVLINDGIFISESHYLVSLIKTNQYDTIYHEHLRYYSLTSLKYLFNKYDMEIIHAKKINTHGGSIRVYAARKKRFEIHKSVTKILNFEKRFLNWKTFINFKKNVVQSKLNLYSILKKLKNKDKKIYGIGAPSRASTLINYVGLDENIIDCVLEIEGSYKIGSYIPGKKIPILSEKKLYNDPPDFVILFSWHIASELKLNLRKKGYKGKFIIPLPQPKIES